MPVTRLPYAQWPACMNWPMPRDFRREIGRVTFQVGKLFDDWHEDRCAMCGQARVLNDRVVSPLVQDHDHRSGFFRGYLCHSCNVSEPNQAGPFEAYRRQSPALRMGVSWVYAQPDWYRYDD